METGPGIEIDVEDLVFFCGVAAEVGLADVKLTGGDPGLYPSLVRAVREIRALDLVRSIEVISRHPKIGTIATELATSGVDLFNMSIDTVDAALHKRITGVDDFTSVKDALAKLVATGTPVKVNTVVLAGLNENEIPTLISFCEEMGVTSLKLLDVIDDLDQGKEFNSVRLHSKGAVGRLHDLYTPLQRIAQWLAAMAVETSVLKQGDLGHPMTVFRMTSGLQVIVKDASAGAWYGPMCSGCPFFPCHDALMALRLTPDLRLQFCLLRHDATIDVSGAVRGRNKEQLRSILADALAQYEQAGFVGNPAQAARTTRTPA